MLPTHTHRQYWPEDPSQAEATKLSKKGVEAKQAAEAAAADSGGGNSSKDKNKGAGTKSGKGKKR